MTNIFKALRKLNYWDVSMESIIFAIDAHSESYIGSYSKNKKEKNLQFNGEWMFYFTGSLGKDEEEELKIYADYVLNGDSEDEVLCYNVDGLSSKPSKIK